MTDTRSAPEQRITELVARALQESGYGIPESKREAKKLVREARLSDRLPLDRMEQAHRSGLEEAARCVEKIGIGSAVGAVAAAIRALKNAAPQSSTAGEKNHAPLQSAVVAAPNSNDETAPR